jgi:hypothetical protein
MGESNHPMIFAYKFLNYSSYFMSTAEALHGQVVADLGCGMHLDSHILLDIIGARGHIAIEPWNINEFYQHLTTEPQGAEQTNKIIRNMRAYIADIQKYDQQQVMYLQERMRQHLSGQAGSIRTALVAEDMLSALRRLPDASVSVLASGIDRCMIGSDRYAALVEKEIVRVLHPQGALVGMNTRLLPEALQKDGQASDDDFTLFRPARVPRAQGMAASRPVQLSLFQ